MQYGLVAEEVARIYPELVTVRSRRQEFDRAIPEFIPMLLNQAQHQAAQMQRLTIRVGQQAEQIAELKVMVEQAIAAQKATHLAAAGSFDR